MVSRGVSACGNTAVDWTIRAHAVPIPWMNLANSHTLEAIWTSGSAYGMLVVSEKRRDHWLPWVDNRLQNHQQRGKTCACAG
ncbi:hypothetical protein J1614_012056 [Plenodomus biglobosus]|nr:hypothetical protein J1614_012056 [Plenodomus biglobosus]